MPLTYQDIQNALGEEAELLLDHTCTTIDKSRLALPGPTFVDDVFAASDRSIQTLRSLQTIYNHGRLGGTGYVSILPVDQGIEHSAGASFAKNPDYFDLVPNTQKEILVDIAKKVKEDVLKQMEASVPESINIMRVLGSKDKKKLKAIMKTMQLEEDNLEDIIKRPDALKVLKTIQHLLDNYGDYDGVEKFFD